jgi:maltose O-acetyltransferase
VSLFRTQKQKMLAGELYHADDPELAADRNAACAWMVLYNGARDASDADRLALLRKLLAKVGNDVVVRPPFYCDYGYNIRIGPDVFLNFNCVVLDVVAVTVGARTQIGPAAQIYAADHPRDPSLRRTGVEFGRPVHIGQDVWIGGGAIILPGVTIGDNAVIGAGSVVTHDVPAGATARGNPARVVAIDARTKSPK